MTLKELKEFADQALKLVISDTTVFFVRENDDGEKEKIDIGAVVVQMYLSPDRKSEVLLSE